MTEKLKLVTDFVLLKLADLVVIKPCGHCGETHRGMLLKWNTSSFRVQPDVSSLEPGAWELSNARCLGLGRLVGPGTVARREVYLVDTGLKRAITSCAHMEFSSRG